MDPVERLSAEGEALVDDQPEAALAKFRAAWDAMPAPREEHESAVVLLAAIADCCFFLGRWDECCSAVQQAFR
jgi:hypothetical protein